MDFVQNIAGSFTSHQGRGPQVPPLPSPWVARWDEAERRMAYINERTGERKWQHPQPGYDPDHGYAERGQATNNHSLGYGAAGVAAGLVGGALLMHEGEKIHHKWEEDKYRAERRFDEHKESIFEEEQRLNAEQRFEERGFEEQRFDERRFEEERRFNEERSFEEEQRFDERRFEEEQRFDERRFEEERISDEEERFNDERRFDNEQRLERFEEEQRFEADW